MRKVGTEAKRLKDSIKEDMHVVGAIEVENRKAGVE